MNFEHSCVRKRNSINENKVKMKPIAEERTRQGRGQHLREFNPKVTHVHPLRGWDKGWQGASQQYPFRAHSCADHGLTLERCTLQDYEGQS